MAEHQPRRNRHRQAVKVKAPARISTLHLGLKRPADILQLLVAHLEPALDLYSAGIEIELFRDRSQQRRRDAHRKEVVLLTYFPYARHAGGNDLYITVYYRAAMTVSASAAVALN